MLEKFRFNTLDKLFTDLDDVLKKIDDPKIADIKEYMIDASMRRFRIIVDVFLKCMKDIIEEKHGLIVASPRPTFKELFAQKIINTQEYEVLLNMLDDRNLSSHNYNESMAEQIATRVRDYRDLMQKVTKRTRSSQ